LTRLAVLATLESQQRGNEDGGLLSARRSQRGDWLVSFKPAKKTPQPLAA
jgi:hypothetical protein